MGVCREEVELYREPRFPEVTLRNNDYDHRILEELEQVFRKGSIVRREFSLGNGLFMCTYSVNVENQKTEKTEKNVVSVYAEKTFKAGFLGDKKAKYSAFVSIHNSNTVCDEIASRVYGRMDYWYESNRLRKIKELSSRIITL
jgi:hypothetical protein